MRVNVFVLFIGIVVLSGCTTIDDFLCGRDSAQSRAVPAIRGENVDQLRAVAKCLGLKPAESKTGDDIVTDIRLAVGGAERQFPKALPDEAISKLEKLLRPSERTVLRKYHQVIVEAQGKKVLYMPEDE